MNYKYLGNSDLKVSTYCLGTMTFGETTSEEDGHYQLDESVASGINFIDTAEMYPTCPLRPETTGDTEIIVGNWISKNKSKRSSIVLATKVSGKVYMAVRNGEGINAKSVKIAIEDMVAPLLIGKDMSSIPDLLLSLQKSLHLFVFNILQHSKRPCP